MVPRRWGKQKEGPRGEVITGPKLQLDRSRLSGVPLATETPQPWGCGSYGHLRGRAEFGEPGTAGSKEEEVLRQGSARHT